MTRQALAIGWAGCELPRVADTPGQLGSMQRHQGCSRAKATGSEAMPPSEIRKIFNAASNMSDVVHLEIGDPDFPTPAHVVEAAYRAARDGFTHYTATAGTLELREAVAAKLLKDNGISCDPSAEIIVTVGAVGAIQNACLAVSIRDEVIVTEPNWPNYVAQVMLSGPSGAFAASRIVGVCLDLDDLRPRSPKTRMIIINRPTIRPAPCCRKAALELAEVALRHDLFILCDEVYEKIIYDGNTHFSLGSVPELREHVITVNALSKTYAMTGWRVGYAAGPKDVIEGITKLQEASASCVSSVVQKALRHSGPQEVELRW